MDRLAQRRRRGLLAATMLLPGTILLGAPAAQSRATGDAPVGGPRMSETGLVVDIPPGVPQPPSLPAGCYLVADLDSGDVIVAKCPHAPSLPASTMKALTALALVDKLAPEDAVVATAEDAAQEGSKVGLVPGSGYTVEQLFYGMLLSSGNDAAWALAGKHGHEQTIRAMNDKTAELGARDTVAVNPSGLDAPGQVTSAYDLALIGRAVLRHDRLAQYVRTRRVPFPGARVPGGGVRPEFEITNHNSLLWNYEGTLGVKNGFTVKAQRTFVGAARRGESAYLVTYVNSTSRTWRDTAALLDWAFAHGRAVKPVGGLVEPDRGGLPRPENAAAMLPVAPVAAAVPTVGVAGLDYVVANPQVLLYASMLTLATALGLARTTKANRAPRPGMPRAAGAARGGSAPVPPSGSPRPARHGAASPGGAHRSTSRSVSGSAASRPARLTRSSASQRSSSPTGPANS